MVSDFSRVFDPLYGNWYTYNSGKSVNSSSVDIAKMSVPSPNYGLTLELFAGKHSK